jgi:hypothetical protein
MGWEELANFRLIRIVEYAKNRGLRIVKMGFLP